MEKKRERKRETERRREREQTSTYVCDKTICLKHDHNWKPLNSLSIGVFN
jgi:hypothetical protein